MPDVRIIVAAQSDVGRVRKNNEDAFTVTDLDSGARLEPDRGPRQLPLGARGVLLALSDGMGGHQAGEVASNLVVDSLRATLHSAGSGAPKEQEIVDAVRGANTQVVNAARTSEKRGMGATLTAVLVRGPEVYVAEVGDSRAYLLRAGRLRQLTRDQSLVQFLVDTGAISAEEAKDSPRKNVILQALGRAEDVRVAIGRLLPRRGDRFLLCCDGLSNALGDDELRDLLADADPRSACARMIDLANERGGEDNLTAIVAHLEGNDFELPGELESVTGTFEVLQDFHIQPQKS